MLLIPEVLSYSWHKKTSPKCRAGSLTGSLVHFLPPLLHPFSGDQCSHHCVAFSSSSPALSGLEPEAPTWLLLMALLFAPQPYQELAVVYFGSEGHRFEQGFD